MGKQYLELPSWQKKKVSSAILHDLLLNIQYQKEQINQFVSKYDSVTPHGFKIALMKSIIPEECKEDLMALHNLYMETSSDFEKASWYVTRVLTRAVDLDVATKTLPEQYWIHLLNVNFDGDLTIEDIFDEKCFNILEQIQINNLILGINNV